MGLRKSRPKYNPIHFFSKLTHDLYQKILRYYCNLTKTAGSKQLPNGRKNAPNLVTLVMTKICFLFRDSMKLAEQIHRGTKRFENYFSSLKKKTRNSCSHLIHKFSDDLLFSGGFNLSFLRSSLLCNYLHNLNPAIKFTTFFIFGRL
jgi:hypothetical protein